MKRIHVNRNTIASNNKHGRTNPPITVRLHSNAKTKTPRKVLRGSTVEVLGPSTFVYRPETPLSCGAKLWVETTASVIIDGEEVK